MKKRALMVLLALLLAVLLTGCVKMEMDVTVKMNGKIDASVLLAIDGSMGELSDLSEYGYSSDDMEELREKGWDVQPYKEDPFVGYRISRKDLDPSELGEASGFDTSGAALIRNGSTYVMDFDLFSSGEDAESTAQMLDFLREIGASVKFRLTLPIKPRAHSATSVSADGKTLEWDLLEMSPGEKIHVEFDAGKAKGAVIAAAVAGLAAVGGVTAFLVSRNRKKAPAAVYPPAGQDNGYYYDTH